MSLTNAIYQATESFPRSEQYGLTSQMRRCAVSVPSNIAEGHGRLTDKGFRVFLGQARGSLFELETQLQITADLGYLQLQAANALIRDCNEVARIINGLLNTLGQSEIP